jgi:hypothetical protein
MPVMKGKNKFAFDRDAAITLKAVDSAAVTSTDTGAAVSLDALTAAYWDNTEIPNQAFTVVLNVPGTQAVAHDDDGDETYVYTIEVDTTSGFASAVTVATITVPRGNAAAGISEYTAILDGDTLSQVEPGATHIRGVMTIGGATDQSIAYNAFLYAPVH